MKYYLRFFLSVAAVFLIFIVSADVVRASGFHVSLTFDDALISQYNHAAPILANAGQPGTLYTPTGLVGTPGYASWGQIAEMANEGWEIGGHSVTHAELPLLSYADMSLEVSQSYADLNQRGFVPMTFASPFGAYNEEVVSVIAKYYKAHRGFHEIGNNTWPYNGYLLHVQQVTNQTSVADVMQWVDAAEQEGAWLIITFHDIKPVVAASDTYAWSSANLVALLDIFTQRGIQAKTVAEVLNGKESILPNSQFDLGLSDGWTTSAPTQVEADTTFHGAVPTPETSLKIIGDTSVVDVFSPTVSIDAAQQYGIRFFANPTELVSGEFGFYLDEYDAEGNWISWQFLGVGDNEYTIDEAFVYQPTSNAVASVGLRMYLAAGSVGNLYIDRVELFEDGLGDELPNSDPTVDPDDSLNDPVALPMPNGEFDEGMSAGWTTSNISQVFVDGNGHGVAPSQATSIGFIAHDRAGHLFSPKIVAGENQEYIVSAYTDTTQLQQSELGMYIDEYDAEGNWISGKWLGAAAALDKSIISFNYVPTNSNVHSFSVQFYVTAGTGVGYVDHVVVEESSIVPTPEPEPIPEGFSQANFDDGLNGGWITDSFEYVVPDTNNNGTSPSADSSIKFVESAQAIHLFSPLVTVDSLIQYSLSVFANTTALQSGELGVYIDEYDAEGNWISGQWLGMFANGVAETKVFTYTPSSPSVATASLQVYRTPAQGDAYIDAISVSY